MVNRRTAKARGSSTERELLHKFYEEDWGAVRAAGSGSIPLEVPDVIAGTKGRSVAVEIKYCSKNSQYLKKQEIIDLLEFSRRFDCEAWVGVKFSRRGWHFIQPKNMRATNKSYVLSYKEATTQAISFEELIK